MGKAKSKYPPAIDNLGCVRPPCRLVFVGKPLISLVSSGHSPCPSWPPNRPEHLPWDISMTRPCWTPSLNWWQHSLTTLLGGNSDPLSPSTLWNLCFQLSLLGKCDRLVSKGFAGMDRQKPPTDTLYLSRNQFAWEIHVLPYGSWLFTHQFDGFIQSNRTPELCELHKSSTLRPRSAWEMFFFPRARGLVTWPLLTTAWSMRRLVFMSIRPDQIESQCILLLLEMHSSLSWHFAHTSTAKLITMRIIVTLLYK